MKNCSILLTLALAGCVGIPPSAPAAHRSVLYGRTADTVPEARSMGCFSDAECQLPARCLKPAGSMRGLCGTSVDSMGMQRITTSTRASGCRFDTDCPAFFACVRIDALNGACVKRPPGGAFGQPVFGR